MCDSKGHVFIFSGSGTNVPAVIPEGVLCQCGMMQAHWEICSACGQKIMKSIKSPSQYDTVILDKEED